jgi:hypothetical protein
LRLTPETGAKVEGDVIGFPPPSGSITVERDLGNAVAGNADGAGDVAERGAGCGRRTGSAGALRGQWRDRRCPSG